jgi:glycosyltransferase involved in cell wall biosynthesis
MLNKIEPYSSRLLNNIIKEINLKVFRYINIDDHMYEKMNFEPTVSFVIPTRNSGMTLELCLSSIYNQNYDKDKLEIIIIDSYSKDNTLEIAKKFTSKIVLHNGSLGEIRDLGFKVAKGDIIAMFDSDVIIPHKDWLKNAIKYFGFNKRISTVWCYSIPPKLLLSKVYVSFEWYFALNEYLKGRYPAGGGNSLFKKTIVEEVKGIGKKIDFGEDFILARKMKERGYITILNPDPIIHFTHTSLKEIITKEIRRNKSFRRNNLKDLTTYSFNEIVFSHFIYMIKAIVNGTLKNKEMFWLLTPLLLYIRALCYILSLQKNDNKKS